MEACQYSAEPVACSISSKISESPSKPTKSYIEIIFENPEQGFNFMIFQNFYTASITIKVLKTGSMPELEDSWTTVYWKELMRNAHFEGDAQDWHYILAQSSFNQNFDRSNCKMMRIYLQQPSPSWMDFYIKNINVYNKWIVSFQKQPKKKALNGGSKFEQLRKGIK